METFSFRVVLADPDSILDDPSNERFAEMCEAVFEAGCDDSTPGASCGVVFVDFDREADSLREAIETAVADVERAGYRVARVEPTGRQVFEGVNAELMQRPTFR